MLPRLPTVPGPLASARSSALRRRLHSRGSPACCEAERLARRQDELEAAALARARQEQQQVAAERAEERARLAAERTRSAEQAHRGAAW